MAIVLLLGGVRSGKSRLASELAARGPARVSVIVTAEGRDEEMAGRIARHRADRPADWRTIEEPSDLAGAFAGVPAGETVVIDCLTLWVSNLIEAGWDDDEIVGRARAVAEEAAARDGSIVVVSNEVGSGLIAPNELGRRFVDLLGRVNTVWADAAQRVALVVAGKVLVLRDAGILDGD